MSPWMGFPHTTTTKGVACPSCLDYQLLMTKVFPKSHKLFLRIREDSISLVRGFFQCLRLVAFLFFFSHCTSVASHARTVLQQCGCFQVWAGGVRGRWKAVHDTCGCPVSPFIGVTAQIKPTVHEIITQIQLESHLSFSHKQKCEAESFSEVHTRCQRCENSRGEKIVFPTGCRVCSSRPLGEQLAVAHTPWNVSGTGAFFS